MGWPYEFLNLTHEEKQLRRHVLDRYAAIAHYSSLLPVLVFLLLRVARLLARLWRHGRRGGGGSGGEYRRLPRSPVVKAARLSAPGGVAIAWRRFVWWMGDDVVFAGAHWGQRDEWLLGTAWMAWLLVLCVLETGRDYMHFTKRFGIIAVSQLPLQYLMALKAPYPLPWIFASSHEQINRYHRVLGRIIYLLAVLHAIFYHIYFLSAGVWLKRFFAPMVFVGVLAFAAFTALSSTALVRVRAYSYRLFFIVHLATALAVPPLIFFHAPATRLYLIEALGVFVVDISVRRVQIIQAPTKIEPVPGTDLLKISPTLPPEKIEQFRASPASHVYLSIPPSSRANASPHPLLFEALFNPFTVASVAPDDSGNDDSSNTITLVARARAGPFTTHLARLAALGPGTEAHLGVDGPYGAVATHFAALLRAAPERTLLVAGGVGAAFALPLYRALLRDALPAPTKAQLVWAIRAAADATWAGAGVLDDEGVQLFLTGDLGLAGDAAAAGGGDGVELDALSRTGRDRRNSRRPNLQKIVDDTFRQGLEEKVAVLVCGPAEMAREVRACVRPWAMKGREVWWHDESFGW